MAFMTNVNALQYDVCEKLTAATEGTPSCRVVCSRLVQAEYEICRGGPGKRSEGC